MAQVTEISIEEFLSAADPETVDAFRAFAAGVVFIIDMVVERICVTAGRAKCAPCVCMAIANLLPEFLVDETMQSIESDPDGFIEKLKDWTTTNTHNFLCNPCTDDFDGSDHVQVVH